MSSLLRPGSIVASLLVAIMLAMARSAPTAATTSALHVWVHWDYMVTSTGRSEAPDAAAMQEVIAAFAARGIVLEIDENHAAIPEHHSIVADWPGASAACFIVPDTDEVTFSTLKAAYFHPTSNHPWHYAVFGYYVDGGLSGCAALPGYDLAIGLGGLRDNGTDVSDPIFFSRAQASTFMHELGHNLGLQHGGDVSANFKPNYLSVMNYAFQLSGIPYSATRGSTQLAGWRLDYSSVALPPLDESHLDETKGIGGNGTDITEFSGNFGFGIGPAAGPIDWNLNGSAAETDVAVDLDNTCVGCPPEHPFDQTPVYERMTGFNDWAEVRSYLSTEDKHPKTDGPGVP